MADNRITAKYYEDNTKEFFESTVTADVTLLYDHFLKYLPDGASILDFGCGSGRDAKAFKDMGFEVAACDGSEDLCKLASEYLGVTVKCMDFMDLEETDRYDAIWACASLLHVASEDLPRLLNKMKDAIKDNGIIYMSFKKGDFEGERDGRFFNDMTTEKFSSVINSITGLTIEEEWYSEDVRRDKNVAWYNCIVRK